MGSGSSVGKQYQQSDLEIKATKFANWYARRLIMLDTVPPILKITKYSHLLLFLIEDGIFVKNSSDECLQKTHYGYKYYDNEKSNTIVKKYVDTKEGDRAITQFEYIDKIFDGNDKIINMFVNNASSFSKQGWFDNLNFNFECPVLIDKIVLALLRRYSAEAFKTNFDTIKLIELTKSNKEVICTADIDEVQKETTIVNIINNTKTIEKNKAYLKWCVNGDEFNDDICSVYTICESRMTIGMVQHFLSQTCAKIH